MFNNKKLSKGLSLPEFLLAMAIVGFLFVVVVIPGIETTMEVKNRKLYTVAVKIISDIMKEVAGDNSSSLPTSGLPGQVGNKVNIIGSISTTSNEGTNSPNMVLSNRMRIYNLNATSYPQTIRVDVDGLKNGESTGVGPASANIYDIKINQDGTVEPTGSPEEDWVYCYAHLMLVTSGEEANVATIVANNTSMNSTQATTLVNNLPGLAVENVTFRDAKQLKDAIGAKGFLIIQYYD